MYFRSCSTLRYWVHFLDWNGERELPAEEVRRRFEPHRVFPGPSQHLWRPWHVFYCLFQERVCQQSFHHRHECQMAGVSPIRNKIHLKSKTVKRFEELKNSKKQRWKLLVLPSSAQFSVSMMKSEQPVQFASQFQLYWRGEHPTKWKVGKLRHTLDWATDYIWLNTINSKILGTRLISVIQLLQSLKSLLSKTMLAFPENFKPKEKPAKCTNLHWWKLSFRNCNKYRQGTEYV